MIDPPAHIVRSIVGLALAVELATTGTLAADLLRVGPGGDHATIQAALHAATLRPAEDLEIALRSGTFAEGLFHATTRTGDLVLSGGWNVDWSARSDDPGETVIAPVSAYLEVGGAVLLRVENLTLAGGTRPFEVFCGSQARVEMAHVVVRDFVTVVDPDNPREGGGLRLASTADCVSLTVTDSDFRNNRIEGGDFNARGAGLHYDGFPPLTIARSSFVGNVSRATGTVLAIAGAGFYASVLKGDLVLADLVVAGNRTEAPNVDPINQQSSGLTGISRMGKLTADRLRVVGNEGAGPQVFLYAVEGPVDVRSSLVAGGSSDGLRMSAGTLSFSTVADNDASAVSFFITGPLVVSNSIILGNGSLAAGPVTFTPENLLAGDALFAARKAGDYRLLPGSAAIDAGDEASTAEIPPFDIRGAARVWGAAPDLGAYEAGPSTCHGDGGTLCLGGGRFAYDVSWRTAQGQRGLGTAVPLSGDSGYFWFFGPSNVEMLVKAIDACSFNDRFWVFAGGLTNVEARLLVEDTATGEIRRYDNPLGTSFDPIQDTSAFASCAASYDPAGATVPAPPPPFVPTGGAGCSPDAETLCLNGGRFQVRGRWQTASGSQGSAGVVPLTSDTGTLWFFSPANVEMVIKVLDGCGLNQRFWVFFTGLTNVEVALEVLDTHTGTLYAYDNALGTPFPAVLDTTAFATCPGG